METPTLEIAPVEGIEYNLNGQPVGISVEEWFDKLDSKLIEHFGEKYRELANENRKRWNRQGSWTFSQL